MVFAPVDVYMITTHVNPALLRHPAVLCHKKCSTTASSILPTDTTLSTAEPDVIRLWHPGKSLCFISIGLDPMFCCIPRIRSGEHRTDSCRGLLILWLIPTSGLSYRETE